MATEPATNLFDVLLRDVSQCTLCDHMQHSHALSAENGPLHARVMFIAEAVGRRGGAITGVPLTRDASGRRFEQFLTIAGIDRGETFVTNAALCNPLDNSGRNRTPTPIEIQHCSPFLRRTIVAVDAPLVVTLGRIALETLRMIQSHTGDLAEGTGVAVPWNGRMLVPLYHPSRQSTLHRSQAQQEEDWRRLGRFVRSMPVA